MDKILVDGIRLSNNPIRRQQDVKMNMRLRPSTPLNLLAQENVIIQQPRLVFFCVPYRVLRLVTCGKGGDSWSQGKNKVAAFIQYGQAKGVVYHVR